MTATVQLALEATSTGEAVQFWTLGVVAVLGALGVVMSTKAVYSALFLAATMVVLATFYMAQGALFLGVVQIVVYTGAVMMLFLFVLMLVGVDTSESLTETLRGHRIAAVAIGIGFGLLIIGELLRDSARAGRLDFVGLDAANSTGNVEGLAELIFVEYVWAFELTGALLITATIGAMILAHREALGPVKGQREMSQDRFRDGSRVTPLPSPGVFARHNGVDRRALLPDGSESESSVNALFADRRSQYKVDGGDER
ncbi:NADH:ubiquinone oxidoreductase subunit J [Rhodococcus sp. 06-412-2C]|uniref:NADH-quinone oxidoreductase subunit J n=1 Tax=unclassified Rhodococcus (in: high G+C Gram-positive bacteria) TaxID=192944 RepID=UPI000B9A404D|nr:MULTISPECIES: NADH-quinone oxidoreductase subunit J [unclassified Rhodococcus (in: high G+C Gram-positive bacteria)]OZC82100.1 NADH:ubiquinone oxidoreductase subunit J [Rhodococcus sp. 06-412-2C]OZC95035.1 NADH:ubiquinone oxidoreductase subunit J [Rhodococcus sp. 06-412-2B]